MTERQRVGIAEISIARAPGLLVAYGLGSCLGIALYDYQQNLGGLAHTLLPAPHGKEVVARKAKFVATAIESMVQDLCGLGAGSERLTAKIVGGANMFEPLQPAVRDGIGSRNIMAAREALAEMQIPLVAEDVGGNFGRTMEFDLDTGQVRVRTIRGGTRLTIL